MLGIEIGSPTRPMFTQTRRACRWGVGALGIVAVLALATPAAQPQPEADVEQLEQQAFKAAVARAADSVVQIQTVGGLDRLQGQTLSGGPATGVIVSPDGDIVSSAFHFASRPTSILVRLPDGTQRPARLIGNDHSRMLTLLKVDVDQELPAAEAAPLAGVQVGQWAIAVGRSFGADQPAVSVGVVSALNRMYGRVVQTDANVSAANYGGPLLDVHGRTIGILAPMSPSQPASVEGENAVAGAEFYDSGIGFAVPLEHILRVLPRWKKQEELHRGVLGVGLKQGSPYATEPTIENVWPNSPAAQAGWRPGDRVVEVDGVKVATQVQLRRQLAPRYAGDVVSIRLRRPEEDDSEIDVETKVTLAAELGAYQHAFLGVLPMRATSKVADEEEEADEEEVDAGVVVRAVWPDSPAAAAGVAGGDRIVAIDGEEIEGVEDAADQLRTANVGDELLVAVDRAGKPLELMAEVSALPNELLNRGSLPTAYGERSSAGDGDLEMHEIRFPDLPQRAWAFQSASDPSAPGQGLVLWLGEADRAAAQQIAGIWEERCRRDQLILLVASPAGEEGWSDADVPFIQRLAQRAAAQFSLDPRRTVVAGVGKAGQMASALAFHIDAFAGVASVDGPLPRTLSVPPNRPGRKLSALVIATEDSPLAVLIRNDVQALQEAGYPAALHTRAARPNDDRQVDAATIATIARWIDVLDRF